MAKNHEALTLLRQWADALIELQLKELKDPAFYGGIMCPACVRVHGRICDAMYPFVYLYARTGDRKYYTAAQEMFRWTEANVFRPDGSNINDLNSMWYGITAFYNIQLGELLYHHADVIESEDYAAWMESYRTTSELIYQTFLHEGNWNVNYRIAICTVMAIAWRVLGDMRYYQTAKRFAQISREHILKDGLIYGEGAPSEGVTPRGQRSVDLGYNVEESLPNLALYLSYIDRDEETEAAVLRSMRAHLAFMLSDGGWDNSWGSRAAKWSYWGSRTSDGCQVAYAVLADRDPQFAEAAYRNFELLKRCTHDGFLTGGPHYSDAGERACVHHTFCHMKGIIPMAELERKQSRPTEVPLPREEADGITVYASADVTLAARGDFRATMSCYDFAMPGEAAIPTGGALTLLYHQKVGTMLAASMNEYVLVEEHNMQIPAVYRNICQTPRIERRDGAVSYRNTLDRTANIAKADRDGRILYQADGVLKNTAQQGSDHFRVLYAITKDEVRLEASTEAKDARYILPVIAKRDETLTLNGKTAVIQRAGGTVKVTCSKELCLDQTRGERILHPCGGFETAWLYVPMEQDETLTFTITVE